MVGTHCATRSSGRRPTRWPCRVIDAHGVTASLGMTFFSSTMKLDEDVQRYLADLQAIAGCLGDRLRAHQALETEGRDVRIPSV